MRPERWMHTIPLRFRSLFHQTQTDQELEDELRDHLERQTEEYVAKGLSPKEARRMALVVLTRTSPRRTSPRWKTLR